jgi:hypothetical protein
LCLKSSKYGAFSATNVHEHPVAPTPFGIPNGIPSTQALIFWNADGRKATTLSELKIKASS